MIYKQKLITLVITSLFLSIVLVQEIDWGVTLNDGVSWLQNEVRNVHEINNSGYIVCGHGKKIEGDFDIWLIKTDLSGNILWSRTFGVNEVDEYIGSCNLTNDNGYILSGGKTDINGNLNIWLIKTDFLGNEQWNQIYNRDYNNYGSFVEQNLDGNFITLSGSWGDDYSDLLLTKSDQNGNEIWTKLIIENTNLYYNSRKVKQTVEGGYIVSGNIFQSSDSDFILIKTDSNGNIEWEKIYGDIEIDEYNDSFDVTSDNGYILCGTKSPVSSTFNPILIKIDSEGNEEWNKMFDYNMFGKSCEQTDDQGYVISGGRYSSQIIKTDNEGVELWSQLYDGYTSGWTIKETSDYGYIVTGTGPYLLKIKPSSLCNEETEVELWGECYNIEETTVLDLSNNQLTGQIPSEIGNLTNLVELNLYYNQLTGIPAEIGNLTNLVELNLSSNQLTGEIPSEIGNLINLTILDLWGNQLTGEIPSEIGNLTNLVHLGLVFNQLTGEIPPEIENLTNLTYLSLYNNQLTGEIPSEIGNLTNLEGLFLSDNQLTGGVLPWIGNLTNLTGLNLYNNQLTGEIPSEIGNLTNLQYLYLFNNQLTGEIPPEICELTNLGLLDLNDNQLCPPYPDCLVNQEPFTDLNYNGIWDEGEPFEDINDNGTYEEDYVGYQDTSECQIFGDLNNDTEINVQDIIVLVDIVLEIFENDYVPTDEELQLGDIYPDGQLNVIDIVGLVNIILDI